MQHMETSVKGAFIYYEYINISSIWDHYLVNHFVKFFFYESRFWLWLWPYASQVLSQVLATSSRVMMKTKWGQKVKYFDNVEREVLWLWRWHHWSKEMCCYVDLCWELTSALARVSLLLILLTYLGELSLLCCGNITLEFYSVVLSSVKTFTWSKICEC